MMILRFVLGLSFVAISLSACLPSTGLPNSVQADSTTEAANE